MTASFGPEARRLLEGVNYAHLATLMADGGPKVEPVWVTLEDGLILVATDAKSIKAVNVERDARVALSITSFDDPYDQLLVRGRVTEEVRGEAARANIDELSQKYTGQPYTNPVTSERVILKISPERTRTH